MLLPDFKELLSLEKSTNLLKNIYKGSVSDNVGNYMSHFKGQGMEFDEVREYAYGDEVRNIDWRVSARTDSMHVKTFHEERQRNVLMIVDNNDYMHFGTRGTFKNVLAAKISSLIGFSANKNMDKVGLYIFGHCKRRYEYFKPKNSNNSLIKGLKSLCNKVEPDSSYSLEGALFNLRRLDSNHNIIFIISSFRNFSDDLEKHLFFLKKSAQIVLVNIIDENDYNIPDIGRIVMKYAGSRFILNSSNKKGREKYKKNFVEDQEKLKQLSNKLRAYLINIKTSDDPIKGLAIGFNKN